jgi:hypothetical protein
MGGHQLFDIAAATLLAMNGYFIGRDQHFSHMAAVGAQKSKSGMYPSFYR